MLALTTGAPQMIMINAQILSLGYTHLHRDHHRHSTELLSLKRMIPAAPARSSFFYALNPNINCK
jgi:hypothetical protein